MSAAHTTRIVIVIPTYNRVSELLWTIEHLTMLPERPPIIVVDNASTDGTAARVGEAFPQVQLIQLRENIGAAARNIGARVARTDYIAFCDDDIRWGAGALTHAVTLLDAHPNIAVLSARVFVGRKERDDPTCIEMAASPLPSDGLPGRAVLGFLAGASVVRREAFLAAGGYESRFFIGGEEELLALDLAASGWSLVYNDKLIAYHRPSTYRNLGHRRRVLIRNALWVAWLRRSRARALRKTFRILRQTGGDRAVFPACVDAVRGLPWVIRNRRVLPPRVEALCDRLEHSARADHLPM